MTKVRPEEPWRGDKPHSVPASPPHRRALGKKEPLMRGRRFEALKKQQQRNHASLGNTAEATLRVVLSCTVVINTHPVCEHRRATSGGRRRPRFEAMVLALNGKGQ